MDITVIFWDEQDIDFLMIKYTTATYFYIPFTIACS